MAVLACPWLARCVVRGDKLTTASQTNDKEKLSFSAFFFFFAVFAGAKPETEMVRFTHGLCNHLILFFIIALRNF